MIMIMMKTHDSSMKIHRKKLQVLLTMGVFGKPDNVYSSEKPIKGVRMEDFFFTKVFPANIWENKKRNFRLIKGALKLSLKLFVLYQIENAVII